LTVGDDIADDDTSQSAPSS